MLTYEENNLVDEVSELRFTGFYGVIPRLEPGSFYRITVITETEEGIRSATGATINQQTCK